MDVPISEIISQFVVAAIIFYFARQNEVYLKDELERERRDHEELKKQYFADLRDWSGLAPRFSTWHTRGEGDTKRLPPLPEDERQKAIERMNE